MVMKIKISFLALMYILCTLLTCCQQQEYEYDFSNPEIVAYVNREAVNKAEIEMMQQLIDYFISISSKNSDYDYEKYGTNNAGNYTYYLIFREDVIEELEYEYFKDIYFFDDIEEYFKLVLKKQIVWDMLSTKEKAELEGFIDYIADGYIDYYKGASSNLGLNEDYIAIIESVAEKYNKTFEECTRSIFVNTFLVYNNIQVYLPKYIKKNLGIKYIEFVEVDYDSGISQDDWEQTKDYYDNLEDIILKDREYLEELLEQANIVMP